MIKARKLLIWPLVVALSLCLCSCGSSEGSPQESAKTDQAAVTPSEPAEVPFYEDGYVTATFKGVSKLTGMDGMGAISVTFQNNSDGEITVYPKDSSVNEMMVQYTSGVPATMQAGKSLNYVWSFTYDGAGISEISEVEKLEFKLWVVNDKTETLVETDVLTVEVK